MLFWGAGWAALISGSLIQPPNLIRNNLSPLAEYGLVLDRTDAQAVINIPISDTLFTRFSGGITRRDGFVEDVLSGDEYTDEDRTTAIGQVRWLASDSLTVDLNVNYAETDQFGRGQRCQTVDDIAGWQSTLFAQLIEPTFGVGANAQILC